MSDAATILGQVMKTINEAYAKAYGGRTIDVSDAKSLCKRVTMLAEDRAAWVTNAKTAEKENQRLQKSIPIGYARQLAFKSSAIKPRTRYLRA